MTIANLYSTRSRFASWHIGWSQCLCCITRGIKTRKWG